MEGHIEEISLIDSQSGGLVKKRALEIEVTEENNPWSKITLSDGSILKFKNPVVKVLRILDESGPDGEPVYIMKQGSLMSVDFSPKELKKSK